MKGSINSDLTKLTCTYMGEHWTWDNNHGQKSNFRVDHSTGPYTYVLTRSDCATALKKAKEDFKKWFEIYKQQDEAGNDVYETFVKTTEESNEIFKEFVNDQLWDRLPFAVKVYTASKESDWVSIAVKKGSEFSDKYAEWAKEAAPRVAKQRGLAEANAIVRTGEEMKTMGALVEVGKFLMESSDAAARIAVKNSEGNQAMREGLRIADKASQSLHKAADLQELIRLLEKECGEQDPGSSPVGNNASDVQMENLSSEMPQVDRAKAAWSAIAQDAAGTQKALTNARAHMEKARMLGAQITAGPTFTLDQFKTFNAETVAGFRDFSAGAQSRVNLRGHLNQIKPAQRTSGRTFGHTRFAVANRQF